MRVPKTAIYVARSEEALRNGSYYRSDGKTFAWYMNGDYLGTKPIAEWPLLPTAEYKTFSREDAKQLIPKCCA